MTEKFVREKLFQLKDEDYKKFHEKLIPNIKSENIIGIRTPVLRKFAHEFAKMPESEEFLKNLPHKYYEENNLHAFLIEVIKDFDTAVSETERFLPYIDNWATCDVFCPKSFKKNTDKLLSYAMKWIKSEHTYTVRYGIGMLMRFYLDEEFSPEYMKTVSEVESDEYYINMMIAWYFATALAKQRDCAMTYFENKSLPQWVHNKAIQKARESFRIDRETKEYLKTLKIF